MNKSEPTRNDFQAAAKQFRAGRLSLAEFTEQFFSASTDRSELRSDALGAQQVCLDLDRQARCGFHEAIFGAGKTSSAIMDAIDRLLQHGQPVLVTRIDESCAHQIVDRYPQARFNREANALTIGRCELIPDGQVAIVTAGTSDFRVAGEAQETLFWMGIDAELIQDVGVAGPQRLLPHLQRLRSCDVVIAIAGFEGALPSVVGGHLDCPVFAVPTSNSFSPGLAGLPPLLAMLNSCAPNVAVVNVDGGFKAGYLAGLFVQRIHRGSTEAFNFSRLVR
jgi:NCAIR mutase (PurE)-related protein